LAGWIGKKEEKSDEVLSGPSVVTGRPSKSLDALQAKSPASSISCSQIFVCTGAAARLAFSCSTFLKP